MALEAPRFRFGEFTLDLAKHHLARGRIEVRVQPRVYDTLCLLVRRAGDLITKDELFREVWRGVAVSDGALARSIADVRRALGDDPVRPRYVQTVPRLGYRFIGAVTRVQKHPVASAPGDRQPPSIAVLPFVNLSPDAERDYFVDGMTDLLIAELSRFRTLRVISRTSVMRFRGVARPLAEIAAELNAETAVEGSVLRAGDRVRVTVQLVDGASDGHLWAESYDRPAQDVMRLQRDVSREASRAIHAALVPEGADVPPPAPDVRPEAQEAYLRGRFFWHKATAEGVEKAVACFQEALAQDPRHAPAWVGLADAAGAGGFFGYVPPREAFPQMQALASRALGIDPGLADAHASLAAARLFFDRDWDAAERGFRRALELNPNHAVAHEWFGWCLLALGRMEEALAEIACARDLDPLGVRTRTSLAIALYFARRHDQGLAEVRRALDLDPHHPQAHCALGLHCQQTGRLDEAVAAFDRALALSGRAADDLASLGHAFASAGKTARAREAVDELLERSRARYVPAVYLAAIFAGLGERDEAFAWLAKAQEERSPWLVFLGVEPWWDPLRGDPRFAELLERVGLRSAR